MNSRHNTYESFLSKLLKLLRLLPPPPHFFHGFMNEYHISLSTNSVNLKNKSQLPQCKNVI